MNEHESCSFAARSGLARGRRWSGWGRSSIEADVGYGALLETLHFWGMSRPAPKVLRTIGTRRKNPFGAGGRPADGGSPGLRSGGPSPNGFTWPFCPGLPPSSHHATWHPLHTFSTRTDSVPNVGPAGKGWRGSSPTPRGGGALRGISSLNLHSPCAKGTACGRRTEASATLLLLQPSQCGTGPRDGARVKARCALRP